MEARWTLPVPVNALLGAGPVLEMRLGRVIALRFSYEADDDSRQTKSLVFEGVEAFKCTFMGGLDSQMLQAYGQLVDCEASAWLGEVSANLMRNAQKANGLVHLMITFDDGPCYEAVCRNFRIEDD